MKIAVQMDPMPGINIKGDSSFALMLAAQARGYTLYHYDVATLSYEAGQITCHAHPVTVRNVPGDHYSFGDPVRLDLGEEIDRGALGKVAATLGGDTRERPEMSRDRAAAAVLRAAQFGHRVAQEGREQRPPRQLELRPARRAAAARRAAHRHCAHAKVG